MEYAVIHEDDVEPTDLSDVDAVPPDLDIKGVTQALGTDQIEATIWYFEPGEQIAYHAHSEQEELYYVLEGEFSLKLGRSGETEIREVGPGTFWAAGPGTGHGHRNVGDERGVILAIGAPKGHDPGRDPHAMAEDDE